MLLSAYIPFPNIAWWGRALSAGSVMLDGGEHFEKMTYRNKYFIAGSNGMIKLSIPLSKGRDQRNLMTEVLIDDKQQWQKQHWRTIESVYKRTPYFEYYEPSLKNLYINPFTQLINFNLSSIIWLSEHLKTSIQIFTAEHYTHSYEMATDIRKRLKPSVGSLPQKSIIPYHQIFSERNGFIANLSMLDLLFAEGPSSKIWLINNNDCIKDWI